MKPEPLKKEIFDVVRVFSDTEGKYTVDELTDRIMELINKRVEWLKKDLKDYYGLMKPEKENIDYKYICLAIIDKAF